jgi:Flp pilus assembly protein TadG
MIRTYFRNQRGAAAVEFAMMLAMFTAALPSAVDLGIYAYDNMQVRNSAQMGVQAVWALCATTFGLPATDTTACPNAQTALNNAVARTSLGTAVTVSNVTEYYYCTDANGALVNASGTKSGGFSPAAALDASTEVPTAPTTCPSGSETSAPGDYIKATVTYTYTPVFSRISVASLLGTTITSTAWMRLQ